ncbi:MAG: AAA family ATPase [Actinomycetota bacterium]
MELIGRDRELVELVEILGRRRVITLVGPGGVGKTALATAAAATLDRPVMTVDLTTVDDPEGVAGAIAAGLGHPDLPSALATPFNEPSVVLIDNCEHVLDAAAEVIEALVHRVDALTVLATSRAPIDLPDEAVVALRPLPVGPDGADPMQGEGPAVELLRRRATDRGAALGDSASSVLVEICRRLDGVPLAIELAAARLHARTPEELLGELDDRPHALARPRFRGKPAHRSVTDLVTWSTDLLAEPDRAFFRRLGVFAGPFTGSMAAAVAGDRTGPVESGSDTELDIEASAAAASVSLDGLVAVSLVVADTSGEATRYRLLHPVRAVAIHQLSEAGELARYRSRLTAHVVGLALGIILSAGSTWDGDLLRRLTALYPDITAAIRWALADGDDDDGRSALVLTAVLWGLVHEGYNREIGALAERVLGRWPDRTAPFWADAASTVATCRGQAGEDEAAITLASDALPHADGSPYARSTLERARARSARNLGRHREALAYFRAGAEAAERADNHPFALEQWADHAVLEAMLGNPAAGLARIDRVVAESVDRDAPINEAWGLACRGLILWRDRPDDADAAFGQALRRSLAVDYPAGVWMAYRGQAFTAFDRGDLAVAAALVLDLIDDIVARGVFGGLRSALDIAALIVERAGFDGWDDLAVTARSLAVVAVSITVDPEFFERAAVTGTVIGTGDALALARSTLGLVAASDAAPDPKAADAHTPGAEVTTPPTSPTAPSIPSPPPEVERAEAVREGEVWRFVYRGRTVMARASKGLDDLAVLLARPDHEIAAIDLLGAAVVGGGSSQDVIDADARRSYEQRIRELQEALDDADAANDRGRSERLTIELDTLVDHLAAATGTGGRTRATATEVERARSTVTKRLRSAVKRLAEHDDRLGAHLRVSIDTGTYCSYRPPEPVTWHIEGHRR